MHSITMNNLSQILPGLWLIRDTCNVYLLKRGDGAIAIDFGSGEWLDVLPELGIECLEHVFLTHHHADQCAGLLARPKWPFAIHAPTGEQSFLSPEAVKDFHKLGRGGGCPPSYSVLPCGVDGIQYDIAPFTSMDWRGGRLRFVQTPGHGPNGCSIILDHGGKQVVFCGDAAHAGATIWQPYHLEWDHWTGTGALAAWEGTERLAGIPADILCPSHGPVVNENTGTMLRTLSRKLMTFYKAKSHISPGEKDRYLESQVLPCGARRVLDNLYQFAGNGYLLVSQSGSALVVDPRANNMPMLESLLAELGGIKPEAAVVTHYHNDHCDGIPYLKDKYGTQVWLHPRVAEPLADVESRNLPWLPSESIQPDHLWPESGTWTWREYEFQIAPAPGQTWWHCMFMAHVSGKRVLFSGDSFQPSSRWNGTGGFCAYNNSRFPDGFVRTSKTILDWKPDILAAGHGDVFRYSSSKFRKIIKWAASAERATIALCPAGDLECDYYSVANARPA